MIFLIFIIASFFFIFHTSELNVRKKPCNELDKPHSWVYKGEEGLVCSECGIMPGGAYEESN